VRVLHLHTGNIYGGVETMLVTLARCSSGSCGAASSLEYSFALCFTGRLFDELSRIGAPVALLGEARLSRPRTVRAARARLRALLATTRPDVVIAHLPWSQVVFGGIVLAAGARTVLWMHGTGDGWLDRWSALRPPDAVICNSDYTREAVPNAYRSLPIAVVHPALRVSPPLETGVRRRVRAELNAPESAVVIVQASRLEPWKGHSVHLRALARLRSQPEWMAWIAGGGDAAYAQSLARLASDLGVAARVRFLGERPDVEQLLAAADVYCQPNVEPEPFGLVFVEALAAGLPVLASDAGGVREIVSAATGVLLPPADEVALASALQELIGNPARRQRLGAAGPARAAELCDPARQSARIAEFIGRLTGASA
jgi:glycosyltransferase involved in cell wall biosynthesis